MTASIDGDRYIFSGDSTSGYEWVYQASRLPVGYTEVEYVQNTTQAYINANLPLYESLGNSYVIQARLTSYPSGGSFEYMISCESSTNPYVGCFMRYQSNALLIGGTNLSTTALTSNGDGTSGLTIACDNTNNTNTGTPITVFCGLNGTSPWRYGKAKFYSVTITKNNTLVRDLVPCTRDSDSMVGMYDIVNDVFYYPPNYTSYQLIAGPTV